MPRRREGPSDFLLTRELRTAIRTLVDSHAQDCTPPDPDDLKSYTASELLKVRRLINQHVTDAECDLKSFSRRNLKKLENWKQWLEAEWKQLDAHFDASAIGKAVPRPPPKPGEYSQVFRLVWARIVKMTSVRKARSCLNGSRKAALWLRHLVQTYASCIELPCL